MTRIAWINGAAGVAGDMLLAALVDAGADRLAVMDAWGALGVDGFAATWERVQRCGVSALWTNLVIHDGHDDEHHDDEHHGGGHDDDEHHGGGHRPAREHHDDEHHDDEHHGGGHRPAREVVDLIGGADLPDRVRRDAIAVYRALAGVEGAVHGVDPGSVELHEVGALDSILDVVGVCAALADLGIERFTYSPIAVGHGTVRTQHGVLPNPVPAVSGLVERAGATVVGVDTTMELSTPTGVALLTVLGDRCAPMPAMRVTASGFGAGTADPPGRPNVVHAIVGEPAGSIASDGMERDGNSCLQVEANVDDATGEVLAHAIARLLAAGAHDAWISPIVMKKGRPAHTVHALCDEAALRAVRAAMVAETGTFGLRAHRVERWPQRRTEIVVDVDGHPVRAKVADHRVKVEHDDAAAAAAALDVPLREVIERAANRARPGRDPG